MPFIRFHTSHIISACIGEIFIITIMLSALCGGVKSSPHFISIDCQYWKKSIKFSSAALTKLISTLFHLLRGNSLNLKQQWISCVVRESESELRSMEVYKSFLEFSTVTKQSEEARWKGKEMSRKLAIDIKCLQGRKDSYT